MKLGQNYEYGDLVGSGGMGDVHRGVRVATNHPVAVKLLRREFLMDEAFVARFVSEKNILRSLQSPNIVSFYDFVVEDDRCAIVMELVDGTDLRAEMVRGPIEAARARQIAIDVLTGLARAHDGHVVHRDVKPSNVLLSRQPDGRTVAKLGDFGIAAVDGIRPPEGSSTGTRAYVAPEVARGSVPDTRSDVYSAGVLVYEMVVGSRPPAHDRPLARPAGWPDAEHGIEWRCVAEMLDPDPAGRPTAHEAVNLVAGRTVIPRQAVAAARDATPGRTVAPTPLAGASARGGRLLRWLTPAVASAVTVAVLAFVLPNCSSDDGERLDAGDRDDTEDTSADDTDDTDSTDPTDDTVAGTLPPLPEPVGLAADDGMVRLEAGTYSIGADNPSISDNAESRREVRNVPAFWIDQFEVTNREYRDFVERFQAPPAASWTAQGFADDLAEHPVQGVSFEWAAAYCATLGKSLPTEVQWEVAASGVDRRPYPWGLDIEAGQLPEQGTYPVGSLPANVSPDGVFDLAGNAWEWVSDTYSDFVPAELRVLRGGENGWVRKNTVRLPIDPLLSNAATKAGFRCAATEVDADAPPGVFGELSARPADVVPQKPVTPDGYVVSETFDDSASGWIEETQPAFRFGYHPNTYFHVESKLPGTEVIAPSPVALDPAQPVRIVANVFVDAPNTDAAGTFEYGLMTRVDDARGGVVFAIDPRSSEWRVMTRSFDGTVVVQRSSRSFRENDLVELAIEQRGDDMSFFINGVRVWGGTIGGFAGNATAFYLRSSDDSPKAHIHFDTYDILELT